MRKPFISVIIPTLNEEKYIESTLKSVKNQDYKKYEIIVADGKSRDKTVKIAKKYADRIVIVRKKGPAAGRNAGAKIAKGKILLFLDADTILLFNALTEFAKAFKANVVGATCPIVPISSKARDFILYWFYDQFAKASIRAKTPQIAGVCCAYRKDAFEKVDGFNEKLKFSEDIDLSKRIGKLGKIVFIEKTLALTSTRRFEKLGLATAARNHLELYLNYLLTGRVKGKNYRPIR